MCEHHHRHGISVTYLNLNRSIHPHALSLACMFWESQLNALPAAIFGSKLHFHEQYLNKLHKLVPNVNVHLKFKVSNDLKIVIIVDAAKNRTHTVDRPWRHHRPFDCRCQTERRIRHRRRTLTMMRCPQIYFQDLLAMTTTTPMQPKR